MAFKFHSGWIIRRSLIPDGVSTFFTADLSEDIKLLSTFSDNAPSAIDIATSGATDGDANNTPIAFVASLAGKKVTWTYDHAPPALNINGVENRFVVEVGFIFSVD